MANIFIGPDALTWSIVFMQCIRFIIPCAMVLSSINMNLIFRCSMQMQAGKGTGMTPDSKHPTRPRRRERHHLERASIRNRPNIPVVVHQDNSRHGQMTKRSIPAEQDYHQPPPPYSFDPPKSESKAQHDAIVRLYEEIMASDAETINVQQRTLETQQDTVRSQAHMIKQMRDILEMQDTHIAQLEETVAGLRARIN